MLQFLRSKAGSLFFKLLFVVLIGAFGFWGIGDVLRTAREETTVIKVGSRSIERDELQHDVQQVIDRSRGQLTLEQAKALGLIPKIVEADVQKALLDQEAARQNLLVSDEQVLDVVRAQAEFRGDDGKFDMTKFLTALGSAGMSQGQFEALVRTDLPRNLVGAPAVQGVAAPAILAETLFRARGEQRIADWVYLPNAGFKDIPAPDDKALHDYYDKHNAAYTAPEYRSFTLLPLQTSDVAASVTITEDKLKDAYQERLASLTKPEKRHILQMILHDQKAADDAEAALASGKDFMEVAKDIAKQDASRVDLGTVAKADLPAQVAEAAFAAKDGEVTKPLKAGAFGWSIIKVTGIEAEAVKPFDDVKGEIEADLRKSAEADALYALHNTVQDALSAGSELPQIADQFKLKTVTVAAADRRGDGPDGKPVTDLPLAIQTVLKIVFETPQGQLSPLEEIGQGTAYYVVKVDRVTPSALKPYDQVADKVKDAWTAEQRASRAAEDAKALVAAVTPDNSLEKVAAARKLQVATTPPFTRDNRSREAPIPEELVKKVFGVKPGEATNAAGPQGQYVAQLKEIKPADPAAEKAGVEQMSAEINKGLSEDLRHEFEAALKQRYPVEIHQAAIDKLFSSTSE